MSIYLEAACLEADPDIFDPETERGTEALTYCHRCPIRETCLRDALSEGDIHTIRGGTTGDQRRRMLRGLEPQRPKSEKRAPKHRPHTEIDHVAISQAINGELRVRLTRDEKPIAVRHLAAEGLTDGQIAARINTAAETVHRIRKRNGIAPGYSREKAS